jgi:hypothetical protein
MGSHAGEGQEEEPARVGGQGGESPEGLETLILGRSDATASPGTTLLSGTARPPWLGMADDRPLALERQTEGQIRSATRWPLRFLQTLSCRLAHPLWPSLVAIRGLTSFSGTAILE